MALTSQVKLSLTQNPLLGGNELTVSGLTRAMGDEGSPSPNRGFSVTRVIMGRVTRVTPEPCVGGGRDCLGLQGTKSLPLLDPYKKVRVLKLAGAVKEAGWIEAGEQIAGCGLMGKRYRCRDCGYEWTVGDWCNHRLCPECGKRRAYALFNAHKRLAGRPNLKHLVLTFKNVDGLTWETVDWIRNCFTRLRNRKLFKNAWVGGVYAIEFTFSKATGWHIHIHALVDGAFVPQAVISRVWKQVTGSSSVVWVTRAKNSRQVLKYVLKPSQELLDDPVALDNLLTVIEGRHFVSGWGKWYRVSEKQLTSWERVCPECGSKYIVFVGWVKGDISYFSYEDTS